MKESPSLTRLLWIAAAAGGLAAGAAQAGDHKRDGGATHHRLFIGDHADGIVRAVEVETGAGAGTSSIDQTPALTRSVSGRTVFAAQGDAGKVAVIGTGLALEDHGDHRDITIDAARLLPTVITGTKPAHFVEGSGVIALFDDGTGGVALFRESEVLAVTDPLKGVVRLISTETLTEERTIAVDGTPYTIVAVGGSGATH